MSGEEDGRKGGKMRKGGGREKNQIGEPDRVKVRGKMQRDKVIVIQWNISNMDTLGPK